MNGPAQRGWSSTPRGRRRVRFACQSCKSRKRKCDGKQPCSACQRYEYQCSYAFPVIGDDPLHQTASYGDSTHQRPLHGLSDTSTNVLVSNGMIDVAHKSPASRQQSNSIDRQDPSITTTASSTDRNIDDNSGAVFARLLGFELDASQAPQAIALGWNLDLAVPNGHPQRNITTVLSQSDWNVLFASFKSSIQPLYSFLDPSIVAAHADRRWGSLSSDDEYDHILCGIAALGSLFSAATGRHASEADLVATAQHKLEPSIRGTSHPTIHDCEALTLHVLYLRCTSSPHAAWLSSCSLMHIIEATRLHREPEQYPPQSDPHDIAIDKVHHENHRRLYWIATILNSWISNEYGRSSVYIHHATCHAPELASTDLLSGLGHLFALSRPLDPNQDIDTSVLSSHLNKVANLTFSSAPLVLSQCNLAFTYWRRIRGRSRIVAASVLHHIIYLGRIGLDVASIIATDGQPWWHVANVPFQFACILLAADTRESIAALPQSVTVLRKVAGQFGTYLPQKALETVQLLIQISQRRRATDLDAFAKCFADAGPAPDATTNTPRLSTLPQSTDILAGLDFDSIMDMLVTNLPDESMADAQFIDWNFGDNGGWQD